MRLLATVLRLLFWHMGILGMLSTKLPVSRRREILGSSPCLNTFMLSDVNIFCA